MTPPSAFRVPPNLRLPAIARLLGLTHDTSPARRFIADAPAQGIDLDLLWAFGTPPDATGVPATGPVRFGLSRGSPASPILHAALIVPGAGRVAMLFASPPQSRPKTDQPEPGLADVVRAACEGARTILGDRLALVQSLAEADQHWLTACLQSAGFVSVGRLLYMRRANEPPDHEPRPMPPGFRVMTARTLGDIDTQNRVLVALLDQTYEGTLDCPELCGLRQTADILDSHRACGRHDPDLWWIVLKEDRPVGCALFNPYPDQGSIELVYLGLAPEARGAGLASALMGVALDRLARLPMTRIACAVDERNTPARRLYDRLGFSRFDARSAWVRPV